MASAMPRPLTIVVVDDDPEMRRYIQRGLERAFAAASRVHQAADGEEALRVVAEHAVDLVITDVLLPRLDGLSLCHALESAEATRTLPVLIVSGELEAVERARALVHGRPHRAFLAKPFNAASLRVAVEALLDAADRGRA